MVRYSFTVDAQLRITGCDRAFEQAFMTSQELAVGAHYADFVTALADKGKDLVLNAMQSGGPIILNSYLVRSFCGVYSLDISIAPIFDETGVVSGAQVSVCPDSIGNRHMQKLVDIRKLASTLAHGTRNPLNAIKGALAYIQQKYAGEDRLVEFAQIMDSEIDRLNQFISGFLGQAYEESDCQLTDVNELLQKVVGMTGLQVRSRHMSIVLDTATVPPITVDPFHLQQAILNIVNNAIEASSPGDVLSVSSLSETIDGQVYVVIAIADSGRVAAWSADESDGTRRSKGRGYGLFITHEVVRSFGGKVQIQSAGGVGTVVRLLLPAAAPEGIFCS
ncbi:MAG: two-component system NtrC family nitrogen regulation sensor histidine kinase GlnL [Nitrospirae bacterium]|nr:MAG: two-component system NtrC family nitrogen regulation sensor histidine kinase GlnL [Nitrospirota bacterium]